MHLFRIRRRENLFEQKVLHFFIETIRRGFRIGRRAVRPSIEGYNVSAPCGGVDEEMGSKSVLSAAVADEMLIEIIFDKEEEAHIVAPFLSIRRLSQDLNDRLKHLFEARALYYDLIFGMPLGIADQEVNIINHIRKRSVQASVRHSNAGVQIESALGRFALARYPIAVRTMLE